MRRNHGPEPTDSTYHSCADAAPANANRLTSVALLAEVGRLTPRDRLVLDLLADHQTLTTEHVASAAFGSVSRARSRLNLLHARGVLDRFRHYQRPGSQSWRWTLAPLGAAIVAAGRDEPMPRAATVRDATARIAMSPTLTHLLTTNGFFVALLAYARHHNETGLDRWWSEPRARAATGGRVRPDGHGVWRDGGRRVPFWLEVDLGTETLGRVVVGKLTDYAQLAGTRRAYPVLFWLTTPTREANLHAALARAGIPAGVSVATANATDADGAGGPAGPVWHLPGRAGRVALAQLPQQPPDPSGGVP